MATIIAFKGVLYDRDRVGDVKKVTAPPYDIISPVEQNGYYNDSPYNVIRLILGKQTPADTDADNRYTRAAAFFKGWQQESILRRDATPCLYSYHQEFNGSGGRMTRDGVIALVRLEEREEGVIIPHEKTLDQPKADRLKLMQACSANFSPIFSLYSDPADNINRMLKKAAGAAVPLEATDHENTFHQLRRVSDPGVIREVSRRLSGQSLFIADGHHRYETALNYRRWLREQNPRHTGNESYNYVMMYLTPLQGTGLLILPYHRVIEHIKSFDFDEFERKLGEYFDISRVAIDGKKPEASWAAFMDRVRAAGARLPSFGMYGSRQACYHLLTLKQGVFSSLRDDDTGSASLKKLDVNIIENFIFKKVLGITSKDLQMQQNITYVHHGSEGLDLVKNKGYQLAFILNATRAGEIQDIAGRGETMPQKSTFFYPKLLSGLVMNPIVPGEMIES
jgi:uncharacterized protein (DUF1015 family)